MASTSFNKHDGDFPSEAGRIDSVKRLKPSPWSSSAEEVGGNLDLLIKILLRLPVRSLVRFKSVSRQWRHLILGTQFPPQHVSHNPKPSISGLYYIWDTYSIPLLGHSLPTFTFMGKTRKSMIARMREVKIDDSCHGLILFSFYSPSSEPQIMVCNPTTQKYKVFHQRALNLHGRLPGSHFYLYFKPSVSPIFKLILIRDTETNYNVDICASNCSIWKTISLQTEPLWGGLFIHGVLSSNGVIYIITDKWYLVQFDVETEKLSAARMTPKMPHSRKVGYFAEHDGGKLVLIVSNKSGLDFMVYEMDTQEGRHWVLKHHIDPTQELHKLPEIHQPISRSNFAVLRVFWDREDNEMDLTLVLGIPEKVISYNHNSKEMKVIRNLPGLDFFNWETTYRNVHPFIGSLCAA